MAYIEALFYYIVIVSAVFGLTYVVLVLVSFIVSSLLVYKKGAVTLGDYISPSERFVSIVKHRFLKFYTLAYFSIFAFFLVIPSSSYFGNDRAYPKAKAYKVVADVSAFYFDFFIANRNLYYKPSGLKYIEPYEKWQEYLMQKAFAYIPEDDAERAIWRYEYYYANYVRARTAPIDFEKLDKNNLKALLQVGGHPTLYKPVAREMIHEVGGLLDMLMDNPMKDKYYDEVNRYGTAILLAGWWENKKHLYYSLGLTYPKGWNQFIDLSYSWTDDRIYLNRVQKLVNFFDKTKKKVEASKVLRSFLKGHKYIYPDLLALRVGLMADLVYVDFLYQDFSCKKILLQQYVNNRREFIDYANNDPIYLKFNKKEKDVPESFIVYKGNSLLTYILNTKCDVDSSILIYKDEIDMDWNVNEITIQKTKRILQRIENER